MILTVKIFFHPSRTFLPCSGVGRHVNNLLLALNENVKINLSLLFAQQWLEDSRQLPENAPLRHLPFQTFTLSERLIERSWKLLGYPNMDKYLQGADWMFSPVDTRFPVKNKKHKVAITVHDIQAFETTLPWSHTPEHKQFRKRWELWLGKAVNEADLVFTVSEFSKQRLIKLLNLPPEKVKVSGNAVDPIFYDQIKLVDKKEVDFPYIAVIGGLRLKKGGREILSLAKTLQTAWPEMKLVTWGENETELQEEAEQLKNIISLEMISDIEMIAWLKGAYASLFLSWYEGFGIPVLEAMACEVPVICSNKASLPEVAGHAAFVVNPDDTEKQFEALIQLKEQTVRHKMITAGLENLKRYSWEQCAENVYKALSEYK